MDGSEGATGSGEGVYRGWPVEGRSHERILAGSYSARSAHPIGDQRRLFATRCGHVGCLSERAAADVVRVSPCTNAP